MKGYPSFLGLLNALVFGYSLVMRQYSLFFALLISILLPLHMAASTLLSAATCPVKEAAKTMAVGGEQVSAPDCCDEDDGNMSCQQMPSCYGCNISCQLASVIVSTFTFSDHTDNPGFEAFLITSFDPGAIWRPPTLS